MAATASSLLEDKENQQQSPIISFIKSQKGKPLLVLDKYIFKLNRSSTTTKYWMCTVIECTTKIHTNLNDELIRIVGKHCHNAEEEQLEVRKFREKVKQRATDETTPIPRIYEEECAKALLSDETIAVLPSEREINSAFNKARRAITPTIPTTQLFDIPDGYSRTLREKEFLVVDKMITRRQRMILFASIEQLQMLFTTETILMDGTFSTCPTIFDQVYTIHAIKFEQSFPCVFGLLPNRVKNTYQFMIQELKSIATQMGLNFEPRTVMTDFETSLLGIVKVEFSTATHVSCYFHFTQALYRAIQRYGLTSTYNNDANARRFCRQIMALALLPEPVIEDAYDQLIDKTSTTMKTTMNDFLVYFEDQWFQKVPITQWCVHGLSMRTNNNAEAFHSRFNRRVQIHHPNIWSFIELLQKEEVRFHHMNIQFDAGLAARTKQVTTTAIQNRIDTLDRRYYDGLLDVMKYLDGLSQVVAKKKK